MLGVVGLLLARQRADLPAVAKQARRLQAMAEAPDAAQPASWRTCARWRCSASAPRPPRSAPVLDGSAPVFHQTWLTQAFLLEAIARDALGDPGSAERALERALDLAEPDGVLFLFLVHPAPGLLERHARHSAHAALIAEILSQLAGRRLAPGYSPLVAALARAGTSSTLPRPAAATAASRKRDDQAARRWLAATPVPGFSPACGRIG